MVKVVLVLSSLVTSPPLSSTSCGINTTLRDPRRAEPSSEKVMVASGGRRRGHYCGNLTLEGMLPWQLDMVMSLPAVELSGLEVWGIRRQDP